MFSMLNMATGFQRAGSALTGGGVTMPSYNGTATIFAGADDVHDDGDWSTAGASSSPLKEFPFQGHGDSTTFLLRQKFQQAASSFSALAANTTHPLFPSALLVEEGAHHDLGGGKIEWERVYATIPLTREEPEDFSYEYQRIIAEQLAPLVLPVNSTVTYQYFLAGQESSYPLSLAPKIIKSGNGFAKIGAGTLSQTGFCIVSPDATILADNDKYGDWKGKIRFRKRRTIPGPTIEFWGSVFNIS